MKSWEVGLGILVYVALVTLFSRLARRANGRTPENPPNPNPQHDSENHRHDGPNPES